MRKDKGFGVESGNEKRLAPLEREESRALAEYDEVTEEETTFEKKEAVRYDDIFDKEKPRSLGWSVSSMIMGILSLLLSTLPFGGLFFAVAAIVLAVVARKNLKYFDGMAIAGLVLGIFGAVVGITVLLFTYGPLAAMYQELLKR
jgi:hypothetical protein